MGNQLRLADAAVEPQHARLRHAQAAWFIQDQNSATGTFVNGQRVTATRLNAGDRITVGDTAMIFQD